MHCLLFTTAPLFIIHTRVKTMNKAKEIKLETSLVGYSSQPFCDYVDSSALFLPEPLSGLSLLSMAMGSMSKSEAAQTAAMVCLA